jgi:hypothetical protein
MFTCLLPQTQAGTSSSSAAAVTRERKLAQLAALQAQLSALQIRQQHRVEVAAAAAAAAHMQPTQGAAVARHLMGISPLDADIDERPSDSRFLRRRSSASGTRPPPVRRNSALLEHTWTSGAGGSPGMGGVMPAGGYEVNGLIKLWEECLAHQIVVKNGTVMACTKQFHERLGRGCTWVDTGQWAEQSHLGLNPDTCLPMLVTAYAAWMTDVLVNHHWHLFTFGRRRLRCGECQWQPCPTPGGWLSFLSAAPDLTRS